MVHALLSSVFSTLLSSVYWDVSHYLCDVTHSTKGRPCRPSFLSLTDSLTIIYTRIWKIERRTLALRNKLPPLFYVQYIPWMCLPSTAGQQPSHQQLLPRVHKMFPDHYGDLCAQWLAVAGCTRAPSLRHETQTTCQRPTQHPECNQNCELPWFFPFDYYFYFLKCCYIFYWVFTVCLASATIGQRW